MMVSFHRASQISHKERLFLPPDIGDGLLPLKITSVDRLIGRPEEVSPLLQRYKRDHYMMAIRDTEDKLGIRLPWIPKSGPELRLSFRSGLVSGLLMSSVPLA